jgi:hypothetical protein
MDDATSPEPFPLKRIIIFRDGVGGPTFRAKVEEFEVQEVLNSIANNKDIKRSGPVEVIYVLVDKSITYRIFYKNGNGNGHGDGSVQNPCPGTVID